MAPKMKAHGAERRDPSRRLRTHALNGHKVRREVTEHAEVATEEEKAAEGYDPQLLDRQHLAHRLPDPPSPGVRTSDHALGRAP